MLPFAVLPFGKRNIVFTINFYFLPLLFFVFAAPLPANKLSFCQFLHVIIYLMRSTLPHTQHQTRYLHQFSADLSTNAS